MAYNDIMERTGDVEALIPEEVEKEIYGNIPQHSAIMSLGRQLRPMARQETTLRVLDGLASAYFVGATTAASGDSAKLQTSELTWDNKYIRAAKLGVIVPIPKDVLADQDYDLWGEVRPNVEEAIGKALDAAVIHGTNAPSDWPDDLVTAATAAGNVKDISDFTDVYDAVLGEGGTVSTLEDDGYFTTGHIGAVSMRAKLRGARSADGVPIFQKDPSQKNAYTLDGEGIFFPRNGALDTAAALLISGDFSQLVYSFRKGLEWEVLKEAVIQDGNGDITMNLAQQDMVALKVTMRWGWQLPNPINRLQATEANRYPFGILTP